MPAYDDNPDVIGDYMWIKAENCAGRNGPDRRGRASAVNAAKRAYEREHGVTLALLCKSYSETHGFLHQSAFRYRIIRPAPPGWTEYTCSGCGASYSALPYDVPPHKCGPA